MTLIEAIAAVEATFGSATHLRVDRLRAREDESSYLLLVLDTSRGRREVDEPVLNGPRLVSKADGVVTRPTVPEALTLAARMGPVRA